MESVGNYDFKELTLSNENSTLFLTDFTSITNYQLHNKVSIKFSEQRTAAILSSTITNTKGIAPPTKSKPITTKPSDLSFSKRRPRNITKAGILSKKDFLKDSQDFQKGYTTGNFPKEYYFIVYVATYLTNQGTFKCTGSLINSLWVLTAASCFAHTTVSPRNVLVITHKGQLTEYLKKRFGKTFDKDYEHVDPNIQERKVALLKTHPDFDEEKLFHDVALLKLKEPFLKKISFLPISKIKMEKKYSNCKVVGFGFLHHPNQEIEGVLRNMTDLTVSTPELGCENSFFPDIAQKQGPFLCFNYFEPRICPGDFGSPLICEGKIWGIGTRNEKSVIKLKDHTCSAPAEEYYFTDLHANAHWIKSIMSKAFTSVKTERKWLLGLLCFLVCYLSSSGEKTKGRKNRVKPRRTKMSNNSLYEDTPFIPKLFDFDDFKPFLYLRIPQGVIAEDDQFPFILFMLVKVSSLLMYRCTGTLITNTWVLTAAHCVSSNVLAKNIIFVAGTANLTDYLNVRKVTIFSENLPDINGTQERRAHHFICHPHFDEGGAPHDVALVKIVERFNVIRPVKLYLERLKGPILNCTVASWGDTSPLFDGLLKYKDGLIITDPKFECKDMKNGQFLCIDFQILQFCIGDAGAPILCNNLLYGVASHYGHLKGLQLYKVICHPSTKYYFNAIFNNLNWITSITKEKGSLVLISWQLIFAFLILQILLTM